MTDDLKFTLQLVDQMSGAADKIAKSMKKLSEELKKTSAETKKMGSPDAGKWSSFFSSVGSGLKSVASGVGDIIVQYGKWLALAGLAAGVYGAKGFIETGLEAAAYKEKTMVSLGLFFKNDMAAAKDFYEQLIDFAGKTPFSTQQAVDLGTLLKSAGFSSQKNENGISDINAAMQGIGNLASAMGKGEEGVSGIMEQIRQIKSLGKLAYADLKILGGYGLDIGAVYDQLAKQSGKSVKDVKKMVSAGKFSADEGLFAIFSVIQKGVGGMMDKQAQTAEGLWSTIKSRPFELMMDVADTQGYGTMKKAMENFSEGLNPKGAGKIVHDEINATFNEILGTTFEGLAGPDGPQAVAAIAVEFVKGFREAFQFVSGIFSYIAEYFRGKGGGSVVAGVIMTFIEVKRVISQVIDVFGMLAKVLKPMVDAMGTVTEAIADTIAPKSGQEKAQDIYNKGGMKGVNQVLASYGRGDNPTANVDAASISTYKALIALKQQYAAEQTGKQLAVDYKDFGISMITAVVEGYEQGTDAAAARIKASNESIFGQAVDYVQTEILDAHSPSRVFYDLGLNTAKGYEQGIYRGAAGISAAMGASIAAPEVAPQANRISATNNATINLTINMGSNDTGDLKTRVLDALGEAFQELGFELGQVE